MSEQRIQAPQRRQGVEILRLVAACGVVLIHFWPRALSSPHPTIDALVIGTSRFAVPFFFTASAYFLRHRLDSLADGWRFASKWIRILLLWHGIHAIWFTILYLARTPDPFHHTPPWLMHLASWDALFEGVAWPLWYLHSLVLCALLTSAIPPRWRIPLLLPAGMALYAMALLWEPWRQVAPTWMPHTPLFINPRGFLFTALLPFSLGLNASRVPNANFARGMILVGLLIQTTEILHLAPARQGQPHEFFLGSVILGASLFWSGLHWNPRWAGEIAWGAASLPMYLIQLIGFSILFRIFGWPLAQAFGTGWTSDVGAICLALPVYAILCHFLASTKAWNRHLC